MIPTMTAPTMQSTRLNGALNLAFENNNGKTSLHIIEQTPPLRVIRAFESGDGAALVHLHNVSGGVLGGDCLELTVNLAPDTAAQLTTTSATRLYKTARGKAPAMQINKIIVGPNALIEMVPDALIPFAGCSYIQHTQIELSDGAGLFWWETVAPGRKASHERFAYDLLDLRLKLSTPQRPLVLEHIRVQPQLVKVGSPARLGPYDYFTTFYICKVGTSSETWLALEHDLGELAIQLSQPNTTLWAVSTLTSDGLVIRGLTQSQPQAAKGLLSFWQAAKSALYGKSPIPPRKIY
jgi:urease accessory protein